MICLYLDGDQDAFAALVHRHINLVHSAAMRQVGSSDLAEEVAQVVFILLSTKAKTFSKDIILSGWLLRTARFAAANIMKSEYRRHDRERAAAETLMSDPATELGWSEVVPHLDQALAELNTKDRNAVALRFFENRSLRDVGNAFGISEDAAKKRVARALEKLRNVLKRHGVRSSAALIATLPVYGVSAAPAGTALQVIAAVKPMAITSAALLSALKGTQLLLRNAARQSFYKWSFIGCFVLACAGILVWGQLSSNRRILGSSPAETMRLQTRALQNADGKAFVDLLDLRPADRQQLGPVLQRVVKSQARLKSALRSRFGAAVDQSRLPFPLDEVTEVELQGARMTVNGAEAVLTWARGSSLHFHKQPAGWQSEFLLRPDRSLSQTADSYEKIDVALQATTTELQAGVHTNVNDAFKAYRARLR